MSAWFWFTLGFLCAALLAAIMYVRAAWREAGLREDEETPQHPPSLCGND